ncbi:hypothetical protein NDU88_001598 [Pleurodeles waltl]|uniref:Uncharacterized protein n=1 Tax=Pleurodeles waltl TaxID=8319 RepID=A0AAV7PD10_PLEWA|nr:hypothetical protein NDU88_001598 [Pleurodeles waltl]
MRRPSRQQAGGPKYAILTLAGTANTARRINTPTATAGQTNSAAVPANSQAADNVPPTLLRPTNPPPFPGREHRR